MMIKSDFCTGLALLLLGCKINEINGKKRIEDIKP